MSEVHPVHAGIAEAELGENEAVVLRPTFEQIMLKLPTRLVNLMLYENFSPAPPLRNSSHFGNWIHEQISIRLQYIPSKLRAHIQSAPAISSPALECPICMDHVTDKEWIIQLEPCRHIMHFSCLNKVGFQVKTNPRMSWNYCADDLSAT